MFQSISFAGLKNSVRFGYAAELSFFKGRKNLEFKPGLNILFGPNGCGKSTILRMLAGTMCAEQGGVTTVTEASIRNAVDMMANISNPRSKLKHSIGLKIAHDAQPVVFCDPRDRIGLAGGHFDNDFFQQGLVEKLTNSRSSHGEAVLTRASTALAVLGGRAQFPAVVDYRVNRKAMNSTWTSALDLVEAAMGASIARGQPSVLLDEPEANCSLVWQSRMWQLLADEAVAANFQILVATHSPYALGIKHANYIEFEPGYREEAEAGLRTRFVG